MKMKTTQIITDHQESNFLDQYPVLPEIGLRQIVLLRVYQCLKSNNWHRGKSASELGVSVRSISNLIKEINAKYGASVKNKC